VVESQRFEQAVAFKPLRMLAGEGRKVPRHRAPGLASAGELGESRSQRRFLRLPHASVVDTVVGVGGTPANGGRQRVLGKQALPAFALGQRTERNGERRLREERTIIGGGVDWRSPPLGPELHAREPKLGGEAQKGSSTE